jgi:hypothetical protein
MLAPGSMRHDQPGHTAGCRGAATTRDHVGIGAGNRLEELTEDHRLPPPVKIVVAGLVDQVMNRSTRLIV